MALTIGELRSASSRLAPCPSSSGSTGVVATASARSIRGGLVASLGRWTTKLPACSSLRGMKIDGTGLADCYSVLDEEESFTSLRERVGRGQGAVCNGHFRGSSPVTEAEKQGWEKRQDESGGGAAAGGSWQWTLNWNEITSNVLVGSCPRSPEDVDRIVRNTGINAILNVQSDVCLDALKIPFHSIRSRAAELGVYLERVEIRDFDHGDQALMLPEAVRMLNMLISRGFKVYVHCTAGINRATLAVVGYLTFVQGMDVDDAVKLVKSARSIAHPYLDSWKEARRRLLEGRTEELSALSREIYEARCGKGLDGTSKSDWEAAQKQAISRTFSRWLRVDLGVIETELDLLDRQYAAALRQVKTEFERDGTSGRVQRKESSTASQYVAAASTVASTPTEKQQEDSVLAEEDPDATLECDVVTRQCFSPNQPDQTLVDKSLRWYLMQERRV